MRQHRQRISALAVRAFLVAAIIGTSAPARLFAVDPVPLPPTTAEAVPLFPTRQALFEIPFQIDPPVPGQEPTEVQLHVSENQGQTWALHAKVTPQEGRFSYRAAHDGEFWFLVRTLSRTGKLLPERPFEPELRVLVDTVPPLLELDLKRGTAGDIVCAWKTSDPNLKIETLQLSYQGVDGGSAWQPITAGNSRPGPDGKSVGSTSFVPNGALPPIYVRAEVTDAAGNQASTQAQLEPRPGDTATNPYSLPSSTSPRPLGQQDNAGIHTLDRRREGPWQPASPGTPTYSPNHPNVPNGMRPFGGSSPARVSDPPSMSRTFPGREQIPPGHDPGFGNGKPPYGNDPAYGNSGVIAGDAPRGNETIPPGRTNSVNTASKPGRPDGGPNAATQDKVGEAIGPGDAELLPTPTPIPGREEIIVGDVPRGGSEPGPSFGNPAGSGLPDVATSPSDPAGDGDARESRRPALNGTDSRSGSNSGNTSSNGPTSSNTALPKVSSIAGDDGPVPAGVKPRLVNSRRFELDYDIESVGTAGVAKVELWGTRDGGNSWTSLGNDPDSTSPYVVIVDREGVYGFRIVIESTTGLRSPSPQPGELPEVWVGVDVTKPDSRITSAQVGEGDRAGEMEVRWEARDSSLISRPVALAFSESADGPWTMIASGLSNTGSYVWRIDSRMPAKMYLKLDVRDEAGNTGTYVTPEPVAIQRVRPQGKIRGVRPIGESARLRMPTDFPKR